MIGYVVRRLAFAVVLVFAVSSASLMLARFAPGDFVTENLGLNARREAVEAERARYGLNRSFGAQYRDWLVGALHLDLGRSMQYDRPVVDLIPERARNTGILALTALVIATLVGLPLGVVTGTRPTGIVSGDARPRRSAISRWRMAASSPHPSARAASMVCCNAAAP